MNEEPVGMTNAQRTEIGRRLARVLKLRRSKGTGERYDTEWGTKTPLGVYLTIRRLMQEGGEDE